MGNMKRSQSEHTSNHHTQHHSHNQHHDNSAFGAVSFQSDPSISYISQNATNANPYSQSLVYYLI